MRLLFYSCPSVFTYVLLVLTACADGQLLAPLMSLASNLNPFNGIASSLTGGVGAGGAGGLRGGLLSSLRGAASSGVGFSALPGGVRNMPIMPAPVAAPSLPFAGFGSSSNLHYGQQMPMLSPEELAEIMHSQSQASPAEFDAFGNAAVQPPKQQQQRGFNNQPVPQPQHQSSNPPAYSQPQGNNFRSPQNSHQGNRDNEYNGNSSEEDGGEDDHRSNDDSDSNDYNAAPPVRRPPPGNQQTNHYNGNNNNNNRYRAPSSQDDNYERPVSDRDRERDYNQFDGPLPARGNNNYPRGPRNENAPVVRGYRVRSPSQDERDNSPANNYNRPHGNNRPEQGNRYLQGGFTPVSAAGGFDGPPDRHVAPSHNNPGVRQNTRPQPAGRPSQHYYNSMHDQRPRDDRDSGDDVDDERDSYGRSPSEQRPQAAYGYYNRDEYANGSDEGEDYERRRKRRTNNSRF